MYAQEDLRTYAPKGAEVMIISENDGVCICEYNGIKFPCSIELLGEKPPKESEQKDDNNLGLF